MPVIHMTHPSLLRGRRALFSFVILVDGSSSPHSSPQNCAHGRQGSAGCEQNVQKMTGRGPTLFLSRLPMHNVPSIDRFVPGATCIVVPYIPRSIIRIRCTARKKQEKKRERWCVQERESVCAIVIPGARGYLIPHMLLRDHFSTSKARGPRRRGGRKIKERATGSPVLEP